MLTRAVIHISLVLMVSTNPLQEDDQARRYLTQYGYLTTMDMTAGLKSFQKLSGLPETGSLDEETTSQMLVGRCGARDIPAGEGQNGKEVLRYSVTKYPESSLLSGDDIDNVLLTAANLWREGGVEIVKNTGGEADSDIEIVFCDLAECVPDHSDEELARPVREDGRVTLYLDSQQSWADETTLSQLSYGGVMHLQVQLLQVILHQFGHALGLEHSDRMSSAMVPFYTEWVNGLQPDKEDLEMVVVSSMNRVESGLFLLALAALMLNCIL